MNMDKVKRLMEQNKFLNDMIESLEDVKAGRVREWKIEKEHS